MWTLVGSLANAVGGPTFDPYGNILSNGAGRSTIELRNDAAYRGLYFSAADIDPDDLYCGSLSLSTDAESITSKPIWQRGSWYDFLREFWDDLAEDGLLDDLGITEPPEDGRPDTGSLGTIETIQPGESQAFRFVLTWHFPNRRNNWDKDTETVVRNHYVNHFSDAWDVADYVYTNFECLDQTTRMFHDALFDSTLPAYVIDAISANIVPVRSNTCFWLEDGRFFGWEGCFDDAGCCAGSCTHVWSYAYTVAYLFPSLEREMRRIEFEVETENSGYMAFRTFKTFDDTWLWQNESIAAVDGQMGSILRAYREWLLHGDLEWLRSIWPGIKRAIGYVSTWDKDGDHVLEGRQHNTYDIEFYGPNPLCSVYYLAAVRAVEQLATIMGEDALADRCRNAVEKGGKRLDELLWNGEYYIQKLDDVDEYKYQHGEGCLSDQLLGQLHAHLLALGDLLPRDHIHQTVKSIVDNNFRVEFWNHTNCQRSYVFNDDSGLILCTWPHGGKPKYPFVYSDEVWTGIEYHVAAHLILEGWLEDGLKLVKAVRDRHDGIRRNPWNEVECGHHYARSMSSWALLLALTGFHVDQGKGTMRFKPVNLDDNMTAFWSNGKAWGTYSQTFDAASGVPSSHIDVLGGTIDDLEILANGKPVGIQ